MAILDHRGEPIRTSALKRELAGPTVSGVRSILSEHPAAGLTPGRLAALLREAETGDARDYLALAEEMEERHLHYLTVLGTHKRQTSQLDVRVVAADDSADTEKDAELVREWVDNEPLEDELVDILDAIGKGFSVTEIMWDMSERQWMPARLEYRDPRWFEFDEVDGRTMYLRDLENHRQPLAAFKFVMHVFRAKSGLPIRGGFARMVAWFYLFSHFGVKDWVQFIETYGQPTRVGRYPPGASEADKGVLLRALTNLGADAAAMIPESMMLELIQGEQGGRGAETAHQSLLAYIDSLISKAVLGQTLTTEAGDKGARSLGEVHDEVRGDIERSDAFALSQTLTRGIPRGLRGAPRVDGRRDSRLGGRGGRERQPSRARESIRMTASARIRPRSSSGARYPNADGERPISRSKYRMSSASDTSPSRSSSAQTARPMADSTTWSACAARRSVVLYRQNAASVSTLLAIGASPCVVGGCGDCHRSTGRGPGPSWRGRGAVAEPAPLPGVLAETEALAGRAAALAERLGGEDMHILRADALHEEHRLVAAMGMSAAKVVALRFGGDSVYIPKAVRALVCHLAGKRWGTGNPRPRLGMVRGDCAALGRSEEFGFGRKRPWERVSGPLRAGLGGLGHAPKGRDHHRKGIGPKAQMSRK